MKQNYKLSAMVLVLISGILSNNLVATTKWVSLGTFTQGTGELNPPVTISWTTNTGSKGTLTLQPGTGAEIKYNGYLERLTAVPEKLKSIYQPSDIYTDSPKVLTFSVGLRTKITRKVKVWRHKMNLPEKNHFAIIGTQYPNIPGYYKRIRIAFENKK